MSAAEDKKTMSTRKLIFFVLCAIVFLLLIFKSTIIGGTSTKGENDVPKGAYRAIAHAKPTCCRVCCSDPRFRNAFRDWTIDELGLNQGQFVPINIAGGPAVLAHKDKMPDQYEFLMEQIKFFLHHFPSINKVVIVGHEDCGFYSRIPGHPDLTHKEKKDLHRAVTALSKELNDIEILASYAFFADDAKTVICFENVAHVR